MVENYVLRSNARKQLGNNIFGETWLLAVLVLVVEGAIVSALAFTAVGSLLVMGGLTYGIARIFVKVMRGNAKIDIVSLFDGFRENFGQTFLLGLLSSLFTALWSILFVIPGIIKYYSYSMAFYIQQDEENKDWKYCLDKSISMMKGHKWQLFCLDLSFIGWYILGAIFFGVGMLFVMPYHETAKANFYEALRAEN